jgi:Carboxypeptidase regulatory-like domain/TonB-dependent Receptor Plug Domain
MRPMKQTFFQFTRRLFVVWIIVLCASPAALAQAGRGGINGLVTDPTGAGIPSAKVTAVNVATGITRSTVTTAAGFYSFVSLDPATYRITATADGFETVTHDKVIVSVDQASEVNITLRVGSATQVITVTGTNELAEGTNSTVGQVISAQTIDRVPLLTRNVYDLVQLSPGVTPANGAPNSSSSFAITNISSGRPGVDVSSYTFNGAIVGSVYYMVDGSPLGIAENNAAAIIPALDLPEDAVEEVRVETQNTPASYQSGGAGVISLVSKSGTNAFHGGAFGYFRPDVLAANEYFNKQSQISNGQPNTPPSFHRYQAGGSIGGPILHDNLFFFGDYEYTTQDLYDGSNYFTVPTSAERTGDFSADSFTIYDPTQPENADGTRQPFVNNIIPNPNPIAVNFLSHMPKCNVGASCDQASNGALNNFFLPGVDPTTAQRFDIRIDWNQSQKQHIFGRFSFDRLFNSTFNAFGNEWDLNYAQNITNGRNILIADDYTLTPTSVLQLRYSFTRHYENQGGDPQQVGTDITSLGFPASLAAAQNYKLLPFAIFTDYISPGGQTSGVGGTANYNTFQYASENSDVSIALTKVVSKHSIDTGFEWLKRFLNVGQPIAPAGSYAFDYSATDQVTNPADGILVGGSDFASFLVGMGTVPGSESNNYPNFSKDLFAAEANGYFGSFVQDTWKPRKNLTITAGLRWDIFRGRTERHNRLEYFDPKAANTVDGVSYTGAEVYVNGNHRSPFDTNLGNFGPRLGFAWQVADNLVFNGSAGIYYGPSTQMVGSASLNSDGFASYTTWNATCFTDAGNTTFNGSNLCSGADPSSPAPSFTGSYSLSNPFPNGVVPTFTTPPPGLANNLGTTLNTVLHSQRTPTIYNFNFGWQYEFPHQVVLSAAYVGSRGLFLPFSKADLNTLDLGTIGQYQSALINNSVPNQWAAIQPATNANYGSSTVPLFISLQEFPQFGSGNYGDGNGVIVNGYPAGDSEYSSLQTKLQKRLTSHVSMLAGFTWAKLITDDGNPPLGFVGSHLGAPQDWKNLQYEHAVSPQDIRRQFTGQASYDLPFGPGRAVDLRGVSNAFLGEWTVNGIFYWSSGIPVASPVVGAPFSYFNQRPDLTCNPGLNAPHTATAWFNPNCFAFPATQFVPGTAPAYLDSVRAMGANNVDLSVYKNFQIREAMAIRIEVSSYNVANRPQFGMPLVPDITTTMSLGQQASGFGSVGTTINTPRQFQFAARFSF